jgi:predicted O-linked N-acetylglucosamine transferase (SPINDLY family)
LPELVANTLDDYRARLLSLAADRAALHGYRAYLEGSRDSNPLFDTKAFARDWEALLLTIYSHAAGIEA